MTRGIIRAAIYVRVSTMRQGVDGTSLATQAERCRAYAAERGYTVSDLHVFQDVQSGGDLFIRPGLRRLREAVDAGEVQVVIAYALDRLTRDQTHLGVLVNLLEEGGARLEFVTETFDDTPVGKFIRSAQAFAAEMERVKGVERSGRARLARVAAGKPLVGSRPPYGYRWNADKSRLVPCTDTAPVVRRIFGELLAGRSLHAIAAGLDEDGIPTPTGIGRWWYTTLTNLVQHPVYAGKPAALRYRHEKFKDGRKKQHRRPQEETVPLPGVAPALVTEEEFAAVRERLEHNRRWTRRAPRDREAALLRGGFVRCGVCGNTLAVVYVSEGVYDYRCVGKSRASACGGTSIRIHRLDPAVWSRVTAVLQNPSLIAERLEVLRQSPPETGALTAIERAFADLERQRRNFIRAIAALSDEEDAAPLAAELTALGKRRALVAAERDALEARQARSQEAQTRLADLEAWCRAIARRLTTLDWQQRRMALIALDVQVTVHGRTHVPRWELQLRIGPDARDEARSIADPVNEHDRQRMASLVSSSPTRSTCSPPPPCSPQMRPSPNCSA